MQQTEALSAFLVAALVFLAAAGLGRLALRGLGIREQSAASIEMGWLATTCGLGLLGLGMLLLGLAGLLLFWLVVPLVLALALVGWWGVVRQWGDWRRTLWDWLRLPGSDWLFRLAAYLLLAMSAGTLVWIVLGHALLPPHEWDEIAYHLPLPQRYIADQRISYIPFVLHSNWPLHTNMLFIPALMLGSDIATHLIMLGHVLLLAWGLVALAHRYCDDRVGIVAVALLVHIPLVQRLAGTATVDIAPGVYTLAALATLLRWQDERRWPWLVLGGALCGFAASGKVMGGGFALLYGLLLLAWEVRQRPLRIGAVLRHGLLFGLAGLAAILPWYARSWAYTGNPIWPLAYGLLGGRNWDALGAEYLDAVLFGKWTLQFPYTPAGLVDAFWSMLTRPEEMDIFLVGFGWLLPAGALFSLLLLGQTSLPRRTARMLWQAFGMSFGFYLLWFLLVSHQLRFLLPIAALWALAAAALLVAAYTAAGGLSTRLRPLAWLLRGALLLALLLLVYQQFPWGSSAGRTLIESREAYLRGGLSREEWLDTRVPHAPVLRYANAHLPPDARIILLPYEPRVYYLERDYFWGNPVSQRLLRFEEIANTQVLAARLEAMGITHALVNQADGSLDIRHEAHYFALIEGLRSQCAEPLFTHNQATLYRLTDCTR